MIRLERVTKVHPGGTKALIDVTLSIERGEMLIFSGPSGAGKSSLLRLIPAIESPTDGAIIVGNQNIATIRQSGINALRQKMGLIFQDRKLLFDRSVFANLLLPLDIAGVSRKESKQRIQAALDKVGLLDREGENPKALSGGEQQRLCIARAIVNRPSILIADEPTAQLDPTHAREIVELLHSFNRGGVTVLVATPDDGMFSSFMARKIVMDKGSVVP